MRQYPFVIFLMGPTASFKTKLAIKLRQRFSIEIVSVDSALVYRDMNIGTAKPSFKDLLIAPHRLINICDPSDSYSVAQFCNAAIHEIYNIILMNRIPLLVGGTMFYFRSLLYGLSSLPSKNIEVRARIKNMSKKIGWVNLHNKLSQIDPISADKIHPNDRQRILRALEVFYLSGKTLTALTSIGCEPLKYRVYSFAIMPSDRRTLYARVEHRFHQMLDMGFEYEVYDLFKRNDLNLDMQSMRCIGYRQMWLYLSNKIDYNNMVNSSICATKNLVKRQVTWLRNWPDIHWLDSDQLCFAFDTIVDIVGL